ncbi:MAG TPA: DNA mismatch repair endonuclease MutL [Bacteroidia bacterium]|nr:DNA mismatch repair endonuclease MutL [Bacteroidia bacterium]
MQDVIRLLPDSVANQIAAGEVIQRPASAVKELLENSVDAGATSIKLIVRDAGRTLIQVVDDGKGMSETDARLSFERHATSKIRHADDLFNLHTMGFRGEALASIAAIAHVELKTRREEDEVGTAIVIEGSVFRSQEPVAVPPGTSFSVKNLFFNVPARRNFLKSDAVEFRHIVEEFERVAFAHPQIAFSLTHNGNELFNLQKGNFRQRIISLYGNPYNPRLVPVEETTDIVSVSGFIIKPEFSKKTRGEQFFFLNKRFIKNPYLHHAVQAAYEQLLPADTYPSYFLFLDVDPKTIDVNIHPTKTEVKFEDERAVYAIIRSTVKKSLGQYNIAPSLDFEQEMSMEIPYRRPGDPVSAPGITVDTSYNPFSDSKNGAGGKGHTHVTHFSPTEKSNLSNWEELFTAHMNAGVIRSETEKEETTAERKKEEFSAKIWQLHERYLLSPIRSGILVIDQQRAHERVLYERYLKIFSGQKMNSQQLLFPETAEFSPSNTALVSGLLDEINQLGFDLRPFGSNTFVIHGVPPGSEEKNALQMLEGMLDNFRQNEQELHLERAENLARSLAKQAAVKPGRAMTAEEMQALVDELFACETPSHAPDGKPAFINFPVEEIDKRFRR